MQLETFGKARNSEPLVMMLVPECEFEDKSFTDSGKALAPGLSRKPLDCKSFTLQTKRKDVFGICPPSSDLSSGAGDE